MYDIAIIGGGPAGYVAAIRAAQLNFKVCLIENDALGGICLNWGCIPTKSLLNAAETYKNIINASEIGIKTGKIEVDIKKIIEFSREKVVKKLQKGIDYLMNKNKIDVIKGFARFLSESEIEIKESSRKIQAKKFVIATGSSPKKLPDFNFDGEKIWNYKHAMTPKKIPKSLLIIGSGAIGMEFASFYNTFGAKVYVIEVLPRILPHEDEEISTLAKKKFELEGVKIYTNTKYKDIKLLKDSAKVIISQNDEDSEISVENIIIAIGVKSNTENMNLEKIGLKIENFIKINENFQTNIENIYAIGDVAGAPCLAHKASFDAVKCVEYIKNGKKTEYPPIPSCTYCIPQIASVGLTERQALDKKLEIRVGRSQFSSNGKAIAGRHTDGFIKNIFDKKTGELLGAHIIGHEATEIIHSYVVGMKAEITDLDYKNMIFAHPTLSEVIHEAVLDSLGESIH